MLDSPSLELMLYSCNFLIIEHLPVSSSSHPLAITILCFYTADYFTCYI